MTILNRHFWAKNGGRFWKSCQNFAKLIQNGAKLAQNVAKLMQKIAKLAHNLRKTLQNYVKKLHNFAPARADILGHREPRGSEKIGHGLTRIFWAAGALGW